MAWFQDLQPCSYFGEQYASFLRAVGWLEHLEPFNQGPSEALFIERLVTLREKLWEPYALHFMGWHECTLCRDRSSRRGSCFNMFIPGGGVIYVCPEAIIHCVQRHQYLPPREFAFAVLACPPMGSIEYFRAILDNGGSALLELDSERIREIAAELLKPVPPPECFKREAFLDICPGMTMSEVEALLGPGNPVGKGESARIGAAGILARSTTTVLDWSEGGQRLVVVLENDRVVRKYQQVHE